jgi:PAS domain S-box-containing protein
MAGKADEERQQWSTNAGLDAYPFDVASGVGLFKLNLSTGDWLPGQGCWNLFGFDKSEAPQRWSDWEKAIFFDDLPKVRKALESARDHGNYETEFRVRHRGVSRWLSGRGSAHTGSDNHVWLIGAYHDISDRKALEARLLALNETLEARVAELSEEKHALDVLNRTGALVASKLDLESVVQTVVDAGVELSGAEFGAFFYNVTDEKGESYTLYALSGAPREAFAKFPMPRNSAVFEPTFRGEAIVRSADITADARYGKNPPYYGKPEGHLPVRSYLAVPVVSRTGTVLGGLFFGHSRVGVFTDRAEKIVAGVASQGAMAIDNANLYRQSRLDLEQLKKTEEELQLLNHSLEQRATVRALELSTSIAQLKDTERRFHLLIEAVTDYAIFMLDPSGHIINWNRGAERIKGYSREEVIGGHFSKFYTPEDRQIGLPAKALGTARLTGKYEAEGWRVRKGGERFWANVLINAIHDENGALLGFAKITRDLTERRTAEEQLRQAQKMEAIGQLTGGIAHDFNNMLHVISGNLSLLQRPEIRDSEGRNKLINSAVRSAQRAALLVQQLLAFSRKQALEPITVSANSLVANVSEMLRRTLGETINVETVLAGGLWKAFVDPNQLESALLNLSLNARDAMPEGGKLTIETANMSLDEHYAEAAGLPPGQYVGIFVSDTGTGMPEDVRAKAFEPFFTTKDIGQGTGLGLSQVYGFVKQSGGHVNIYSEFGAGTTVKIYLPRHTGAHAAEGSPAVAQTMPEGRGETILVVEDEADVRVFTAEVLRNLKYKVVEAAEGPMALRLLDSHPEIKLLFTDVGLPGGMNGRQLADEAKRRRAELKVLFTTGYAKNAIVHHGRLDPGVELLAKPFTLHALVARIRRILDEQ